MAVSGDMKKVSGRQRAISIVPVSPGIAPTKTPVNTPMTMRSNGTGVRTNPNAISKPSISLPKGWKVDEESLCKKEFATEADEAAGGERDWQAARPYRPLQETGGRRD